MVDGTIDFKVFYFQGGQKMLLLLFPHLFLAATQNKETKLKIVSKTLDYMYFF